MENNIQSRNEATREAPSDVEALATFEATVLKDRIAILEAELRSWQYRFERDVAQARIAELERELEAAVRRADLCTAQILAIASVIDGDDKGETRDNPRWTPTLEHARRLRSQLEALIKAPEGDVLAERVYGMQALGFTLNALPPDIRGGIAGDTVRGLEAHLRDCMAEIRRLRSQLATVTADRDWFLKALGDCVKAMELWGSQEDGVPEAGEDLMGSIGKAYDNAKAILRWPDDPTLRKAPSAPAPKPLTAEECEQALLRGDTVLVSGLPSPYRVRCGVLESLKGGLWRLSLLNVRDIVNEVRNGAECFLVLDPSQEQEVRHG